MKPKTRDLLKKITVAVSVIGAVGTLVAIGDTMFGGSSGGGPAGGQIITPNPGPQGGGGSGGTGQVTPDVPKYDIDIPAGSEEIFPTFFVGNIVDFSGEHDMTTKNLFNPWAFECNNLTVAIDPESNISYEVYFYNASNAFMSKTEDFKTSQNVPVPDGAFARLELHYNQSINWKNTPEIANNVHVFTDKGKRVDIDDMSICDAGRLNSLNGANCMFFKNGDYKTTSHNVNIKNGLWTITGKGVTLGKEMLPIDFAYGKSFVGTFNFTVNPINNDTDRLGDWYIKSSQGATHATREDKFYRITPGTNFKTMGHEAGNMLCQGWHFAFENKDFTKPFQFIPYLTEIN